MSVSIDDPEVLFVEPILISSSDTKHSDDFAFALLQPIVRVVITHSFKEDSDSDTNSREVNMAPRFRTLG